MSRNDSFPISGGLAAALLALAAGLLPLAGCPSHAGGAGNAGRQTTDPARPGAATAAATAPAVRGASPQATRPDNEANTADLFALAARTGAFKVTVGKQAGTTFNYTMAQEGKLWHWKWAGKADTFYAVAANGDIQIVREDDAAEAVRVEYDPPIATPATLTVGKPFDGKCHITVHRQSDNSIRQQGQMTYKTELLEHKTVTTPAGKFEAYIVRTTRDMHLSAAHVNVTITDAYVPGRGEVLERIDQVVHPLGIGSIASHDERQLAPAAP